MIWLKNIGTKVFMKASLSLIANARPSLIQMTAESACSEFDACSSISCNLNGNKLLFSFACCGAGRTSEGGKPREHPETRWGYFVELIEFMVAFSTGSIEPMMWGDGLWWVAGAHLSRDDCQEVTRSRQFLGR